MASKRVIVFGGNGGTARLMTAGMLAKGWNVTSVIRNQRQAANILKLGAGTPGNINTIVADLKDLKSVADARTLMSQSQSEIVVFAAGESILSFSVSFRIAKLWKRFPLSAVSD